ncbi:MAG TPA: twin-arginine translocase subunit TatC [Candidatus Dormibacteraeota bacterium]
MKVFQRRSRSAVDEPMTIIEHLEALRRVLIVALIAWTGTTIVAWFFSAQVYDLLLQRAHVPKAFIFTPTGFFFLRLKVALYLGIAIASPVIVQQIWSFVSPGLYLHERRLFAPLVVATLFFFAVGITFALFALPYVMRVLTGFAPPDVQFFPDASALLSFILALILGFGLVFELPVVLYVLGRLGIVNSRWLWKNRPYWIIALGLLANILTPGGDVFTPFFLFVPLYLFYEGTTLLLRLSGK